MTPDFQSWSHATLVQFAREAYEELTRLKRNKPIPMTPCLFGLTEGERSLRDQIRRNSANHDRDNGAAP